MERLLLADDSEIVLQMLGAQLRAEGFEVVSCPSGTEALAAATSRGPFDLFILDVMMPDLTGFEVTRRLRREASCASTPVLLLTSLDGTDDKVNGLESGADDFLTKTVSDAELVARVRSLVEMGQARRRQSTAASMVGGGANEQEPARHRLYVVHDDPAVGASLLALCREELRLDPDASDVVAELGHLQRLSPDLVLISFECAVSGPQRLSGMLQVWDSPPGILVVDAQPSAERRIAAYQSGAEDYFGQGTPRQEIAARLASALRRRQRYLTLESSRARALEAAITDRLTGLTNRAYFEEALRRECQRATSSGQPAAVVLLDVDHFKKVNDRWGHAAGDLVLQELSRRLTRTLRSSDVAARYGGEEFILLLPATQVAHALSVAERVRAAMESAPFEVGPARLRVTASLGVALTAAGADAQQVVAAADQALYAAKRAGRNRVVLNGQAAGQESQVRCPLCDASALLTALLAEDLDNPLAAVHAAAHLAPGEHAILQGVRDSADAVLARLVELETALQEASRDHLCPRRGDADQGRR